MKIKFFLLSFILPIIYVAQINIGVANFIQASSSSGKLDESTLSEFKNSTTVLILPDKEKNRIDDYKKAISPIWNFNKLEVICQKDYATYSQKPGYSFISISWFLKDNGSISNHAWFNLEYWLPYTTKRNKTETKTIALVKLYPDDKSENTLNAIKIHSDEDKTRAEMTLAVQTATFYNYSPSHLKCYLSFISQSLTNKETRGLREESNDAELLKKLSKDTLFLPSYVTINPGTIFDKAKMEDVKKLMEEYEFKYQLLSDIDLDNKITNSKKPTFILTYLFIQGGDKYITIFESKSGKIAYAVNIMAMKPLRTNDLGALSKKIQKSIK